MITVMSLGVLLRDDGTLIQERVRLYATMREGGFTVILLSHLSDERAVRDLLRREHIEYDNVICLPENWALDLNEWKVHKVRHLLGGSFRIVFYVDDNEDACAKMREQGITTLLVQGRVSMTEQARAQEHVVVPWAERVL